MFITEIRVRGESGTTYTVKPNPTGGMYCTCPAWKHQSAPISDRMCKHIKFASRALLGIA